MNVTSSYRVLQIVFTVRKSHLSRCPFCLNIVLVCLSPSVIDLLNAVWMLHCVW